MGIPGVEAIAAKNWCTEAEIQWMMQLLQLKTQLTNSEHQLAEEHRIQTLVEKSQERLRQNIKALSSDQGMIKDNPLVTRCIEAMGQEEDKLQASTQTETALRKEQKAQEQEQKDCERELKAAIRARLDNYEIM